MDIAEITTDWLKEQKFDVQKNVTIDGVYVKELAPIVDGRGEITNFGVSLGWMIKI